MCEVQAARPALTPSSFIRFPPNGTAGNAASPRAWPQTATRQQVCAPFRCQPCLYCSWIPLINAAWASCQVTGAMCWADNQEQELGLIPKEP